MKKRYIEPISKHILLVGEGSVLVDSGITEDDVMTRKTTLDNRNRTIWGNWDDSDE